MGLRRISASIVTALLLQPAFANPTGPQVVSGTASFSQPNANTLNVTNSHNAIINWQGFNIGAGQTTNFIQPSSSSAVLNRVLSNSPSQIHGNLNSNGRVFLINQHGLLIGAGARISTAGFYGSTLNITNEDFLKGNLKFEGGGFGGIHNYGYIHAGPNGNVVLIAPDIENGGVIEVDNGNVVLAAGESIRITSLNDASIEFDLQSPDNGIVNLGEIIARQGAARLFAGHLRHSGAINATGVVRNADGTISLVAQDDIEVTTGATLEADGDEGGSITVQSHHGDVYFFGSASARGETRHGGEIQILGDRVGLFDEAKVDASGRTGGGEVLVGGDFQGKGETQAATQTQVGPHAEIHADAIDSGDGGTVIVWADGHTQFSGAATATGGEAAGDGGFIEISGKGSLAFDGAVDASADNGNAGSVLFDPIDILIQISGPDQIPPANTILFTDSPGVSLTIDPNAITSITEGSTNVILQANRDITVASAIIANASGLGGDLTLQAGQSIKINADINTDNGSLFLYANSALDAVTPTAPDPGERGTGTAEITQDPLATITTGTGNVEIWMNSGVDGVAGDITVGNINAAHVLIKHNGLDAGGDILQNAGSVITALSVFVDHDGPTDGSVGTSIDPLRLVVDNLGAHIHEPTLNGIFIDAAPNSLGSVAVGGTCYGTGLVAGCDTFGPHGITGLETVNGGGDIALLVNGDLNLNDPVGVDDVLGTGNAGDISLGAAGSITVNNAVFNTIGDISIGANADINVNADITAAAALTGIFFDADADLLGGGQINLNGNLFAGAGLIDASTDSVSINLASASVDSDMTVRDLFLVEGTLSGSGNISVFGQTIWNPADATGAAQNFFLLGTGILFADGGFDLGPNLNNDTLTLDRLLTVGGLNSFWTDVGLGGSSIIGIGQIINSSRIGVSNAAQLDVGVQFFNDGSLSKDSGPGLLLISGLFTANPGSSLFISEGTSVSLGGASLFLSDLAELGGAGIFVGDVFSSGGLVSVESSTGGTGTLTINGSLTLDLFSTLAFDLAGTTQGTGYDFLDVSGNVDLNGTLAVLWDNGFTSTNGTAFDLIRTGGTFLGGFDTIIDPAGVTLSSFNTTTPTIFQYVTDTVSPSIVFWNVNASGNWNTATNWSTGVLPGAGDYVVIDQDDSLIVITIDSPVTILGMQAENNVTVASTGSLTMNDDLLFTADNFVLDSLGTGLTMNGIATIAGQLDWNSGAIAGSGSIDIYRFGVLNINPGAGNLDNAVFVNGVQPSTWAGGAAAGTGTIAVNGSLDLFGTFSSPIPLSINSSGTVTKGDAGTVTLTGTTVNNGFAQLDNGTLVLQASSAHAGTFDIGIAATLALGGTQFLNGGLWGGGTLDTTAAISVDAAGVIEPGGPGEIGFLDVVGDLVVSGLLQIDISSGVAPVPGVDYDRLAISGQADLTGLLGLVSFGGYTVTDGDTFVPVTYSLKTANEFAGVFPIGGEVVAPTYGGTGLTLVLNPLLGLFTFTGGGDGSSWNDPQNWDLGIPGIGNDAAIPLGFDVTIAAAASANALSLAAGSTLTLNANTLTLGADSTLAGLLTVNGGTLDLGVTTLAAAGGLDWTGPSTIQGGTLNLPGGALLDISGAGLHLLNGTLVNGNITLNNAILEKLGGTLQLNTGSSLNGVGTVIGDLVNNGGIIRPGGAGVRGTLTINGDYTNSAGTLEVEIDGAATHDVLAVNNFVDSGNPAASILDISLLAFIPAVGQTHDVITCAATCTTVTQFGLVNEPAGVTHTVAYNTASLNLTVASVAFFWDGGGDGVSWFDLGNWSLDVLPNAGTDVVLINGDNVTFDGVAATIASLTLDSGSSLNIANGTLTNAGLLSVNGGATLGISGGTLDNGGDANVDGSFLIGSGAATFRGNSVVNGNYVNNGGNATFTGTAAFNGSNTHAGGTTIFNNTSSFAGATQISGGTLEFNAVGTMLGLNNAWTGGVIRGPVPTARNLVLGVASGDTTLAVAGAAVKALDAITLDMNLNDINMSGTGDLVLANGAVIDNTGGTSFFHGGNGGIVGAGTFINNGGAFNSTGGLKSVSVDFQNDVSSTVNVSAGALLLNDADAGDPGTYNIGASGAIVFQQDRNLQGALNLAGSAVVGDNVTLTLPANLNLSGNLLLNAASLATVPTTVLDLSNLTASTLVLNGGASLGGSGTVNGNVVNASGVVVVGGTGALGELDITGNYNQGLASAIVVEVFNNGITTVSDNFTVGGATTLNGGTLVVGFTTNSLGLVTADFQPFDFQSGVSGRFARVFDAGGNILFIDFSGGVFTILGAPPVIPDSVIDDLVAFLENKRLEETIANNESLADAVMEELLELDEEDASLVCK